MDTLLASGSLREVSGWLFGLAVGKNMNDVARENWRFFKLSPKNSKCFV